MPDITITTVSVNEPLYQQVYDLREEVLRKPIGLSLKNEDLSGDALDTITVALENEKVIGCVMLHSHESPEIIKLRQMAVAYTHQGKGIGRMLVLAAEAHARESGIKKIVLHARITAEPFYKKLGYLTTSGEFTEVDIPHVVMEKAL